jgi:hypothetical protein
MGAHHGAVEELHQVRCPALFGEQLEEAANTPVRLSRQNRFQTLFQLPNLAGKARQVMLCTVKKWIACRNLRSLWPASPRLDCTASNTVSARSQSASVICVSIAGSLLPVTQ